ncbi:hypothetical protein BT67DRAFT_391140 [Trichocladium antarcticum]|uniref:SHSP domain-containing protein n=1 Tax=Trichocladium antarcticum TaxID=1450529 RepID=A0AAN6UCZ9_9PEZI|nr:hypothetical protein BT67DRAFT_391140 [Trichocladium antarcticum]
MEEGRGRERAGGTAAGFVPPVDVFDGPQGWTVQVAVPGAKRADVGVSWDAERSALRVSGAVKRAGGDRLVGSMAMGEREVGGFTREIRLPPRGGAGEVDGGGIGFAVEDGLLSVTVPRKAGR